MEQKITLMTTITGGCWTTACSARMFTSKTFFSYYDCSCWAANSARTSKYLMKCRRNIQRGNHHRLILRYIFHQGRREHTKLHWIHNHSHKFHKLRNHHLISYICYNWPYKEHSLCLLGQDRYLEGKHSCCHQEKIQEHRNHNTLVFQGKKHS